MPAILRVETLDHLVIGTGTSDAPVACPGGSHPCACGNMAPAVLLVGFNA